MFPPPLNFFQTEEDFSVDVFPKLNSYIFAMTLKPNLKIVFFQNTTLGQYVEKLLCIIVDMLKCRYAEVSSYVVSNDVLSSYVKTSPPLHPLPLGAGSVKKYDNWYLWLLVQMYQK